MNLLRDYDSEITVSNHNHFKSVNDAVEPVSNMLKAFLAAGYKTIGVTDHGCFTSIQNIYHLIKNKKDFSDLKIFYGIEMYVQMPDEPNLPKYTIQDKVSHLIVYAKTEEGKHILDKLNSKAKERRYGQPIVLWEDLKNNVKPGSLIATSACIAGAPANQLFRNNFLEKKLQKLINKQNTQETDDSGNVIEQKYISPDDFEYQATKWELFRLTAQIVVLKAELNDSQRKAHLRALKISLRTAQKEKDTEAEKEISEEIDEILDRNVNLKIKIDELKDRKSETNKKFKYLNNKVSDWMQIQEEIDKLKKDFIPENLCIENAKETVRLYDSIFGHGNYFVEVQNHGMKEESYAYQILANIASDLNIPLIAANDAHMASNTAESLDKRNVARYLRFGNIDENPWDAELYVKTPNELALALSQILSPEKVDEAMMNLNVLNEKITYEPKIEAHYPVFDKNKDSAQLLRETAYKNIEWRYPNRIGWDEEHEKRLEYELNTIIQMGFADYHLIVKDFLEYGRICGKIPQEELKDVPLTIEGAEQYAKEHNYTIGIGIGIGRGSGAGSLVTYLLGITGIDPFKFGLIFERFLNPERISMPDIDSDFSIGVREKTIDYVKAKYGTDAVVGIITENREGVKGAIRDAARYLGKKMFDDDKYFLSLGNQIRKKVPNGVNISFNTIIATRESEMGEIINITIKDLLEQEFSENENALNIISVAEHLEGMLCTYGQHAAGVIIYDDKDITDYIPIRDSNSKNNVDNIRITECDKIESEEIKLLKMDFLGLRTLSILTDTARLVKRNYGIDIQFENIPLEGPEAQIVLQNIYAKGNTKNVFQFESPGMRKYLKQLMVKQNS